MMLQLLGYLLVAGITTYGVYKLFTGVTLKSTTERYKYVKTKDEEGNEIIKVIDLSGEKS